VFLPYVSVLLEAGLELHPHEEEVDEVPEDPYDDGHLYLGGRGRRPDAAESRESHGQPAVHGAYILDNAGGRRDRCVLFPGGRGYAHEGTQRDG
jgi:hypothetical protein